MPPQWPWIQYFRPGSFRSRSSKSKFLNWLLRQRSYMITCVREKYLLSWLCHLNSIWWRRISMDLDLKWITQAWRMALHSRSTGFLRVQTFFLCSLTTACSSVQFSLLRDASPCATKTSSRKIKLTWLEPLYQWNSWSQMLDSLPVCLEMSTCTTTTTYQRRLFSKLWNSTSREDSWNWVKTRLSWQFRTRSYSQFCNSLVTSYNVCLILIWLF